MLAKSPVVTAVAILSLALGIGANTAIFSLLNALLLRPLPVRDPARLVHLYTTTAANPDRKGALSFATYQQIRKNQRVFSDVFSGTGDGIYNLEANGVTYVGGVNSVTGEYFSSLGIQPVLGRWIAPEDVSLDGSLSAPVAVLDYRCWQRRYNGDPGVIGKTIQVVGRPLTIIGVMPAKFAGLNIDAAPDVAVPVGSVDKVSGRDRTETFARLQPGASIEQARAQLESVWPATLEASLPEGLTAPRRAAFLGQRLALESMATGSSYLRGAYSRALFVLMGMVGVLLLIACANLVNLMLARAAARQEEFGIRVALGAGAWRIVRQMLAEGLMLSAAGAVCGVILAGWASRLFIHTMWSGYIPSSLDVSPDARVLALTAVVSLLTGVLVGVSPAWSCYRSDPAIALRRVRTVRGSAMGFGKALIGAQVALSLVLLIGAVVFVRSLKNLRFADVGFRRDGLVLMQLFPQKGSETQSMPNRTAYYRELADRLSALPGVESVSYSHMGPVLSYEFTDPASVSNSQEPPLQAAFEAVGPGFFHLAGMRLLDGREFDWRDNETVRPVAIISQSLARRLFASASPIGKRIDFGNRKGLEIVGVVNSASLWLPQSREPMAVYLALMQWPAYNSSMADLRVTGDPQAIIPAARRALESLGRQTTLRTQTVEQRAAMFLSADRMIAMLSSFFGGLALLLASVGLYGIMSFAVARRTSEIGLRMALGAQNSGVLQLMLGDVLKVVLAGMAVGVPAALAASRLISRMVYGVSAKDPLTILLASSILLSVALLAGYLPARRASRIDPMAALRSE
jgi:predicted permease